MSELGDFLFTAFAFFAFFAIVVGAVGGWVVIVALLAREQEFQREAQHAALDAASHPIVGRKESY